jgi:hypothetical protein
VISLAHGVVLGGRAGQRAESTAEPSKTLGGRHTAGPPLPGEVALVSDQCMQADVRNNTVPGSIDGLSSCFRYEKTENGAACVYITEFPSHKVFVENSGVKLCFNLQKFTLLKPVKSKVTTQVSQTGLIKLATSGIKIFGALKKTLRHSITRLLNAMVLRKPRELGTTIVKSNVR